jgi:lipopolysaccharide transport system permease protein
MAQRRVDDMPVRPEPSPALVILMDAQAPPAAAVRERTRSSLAHLRDVALELVLRDLRLRYKRSVLGIAWSLVTPLSQLLVLHFVFTVVLPLDIPHYASFLFVGILVWGWLAGSLEQATGSIVDNRELVRQPGFPVAILPIVTVAANLIHFLLALPILALFLWLGGGATVGGSLVLLPAMIMLQFLFILSIAYLVATFHVNFRDTRHLLGVLLTLGFYLTPVFYEVRQAPARFEALYALNPMVHVIDAYRDVLLRGMWPPLTGLTAVALTSGVLLLLGYTLFRRTHYRFVDEL